MIDNIMITPMVEAYHTPMAAADGLMCRQNTGLNEYRNARVPVNTNII